MACRAPTITINGITISTSEFANARELIQNISGDQGDPTQDGYDENIANGNNDKKSTGVQFPPPKQTEPPAPIDQKPDKKDDKPPTEKQGEPTECDTWTGDYNQKLSPNFTVQDFTIGAYYPHQLTDSGSMTAQQRFCNLQNLAKNVAEPIRAKFGNFRITSGLRNTTSAENGTSQHLVGQAVDIQFPGMTYDQQWEAAKWVKENIAYDQLIFEHSSNTGNTWLHVSYNKSGNRPADASNKVMTMFRNKFSPGLRAFN